MKAKHKIRFQPNLDFEIKDDLIQTIEKIKALQPELFRKTK